MNQPPQVIVIGNVNQSLDKFDDSIQLTKCGGYKKINAIRVYYTDKYVRGFEIFYKLNDGDLLKAGHNVPKKKSELKSQVFEIGPDDYISEIQGAYFKDGKKFKIANITFLTYRGKAGTYGGKGEKSFGFAFEGFSFGAFSGGYKKQIEWLVIPVIPLPQEFQDELKKVQVNVFISGANQIQPGQVRAPNFVQVNMPQIALLKQDSAPLQKLSQEEDNIERRQSNPLLSSKYPTFNKQPQYTAQPLYPGPNNTQQFQYPSYPYPGQMNQNPYQPPK